MSRHLCISVTLLDPLFHGKGDGNEPEWPPSPMRLFQALLAGSRTGCRNGRWSDVDDNPLRAAFRWLERRDPPLIVAPQARRAAGYKFFVPNNDSDKKPDRQDRLTSKTAQPYRLGGHTAEAEVGRTLHYLWAIPEKGWPEARPRVELLCREARHLLALGWGIDQAVADGRILTNAEVAGLSGRRWLAWRRAFADRRRYRIPKEGSLSDLEYAYESFANRVRVVRRGRKAALEYAPARKARCFDQAVYLPVGLLPPRPCAVFELPQGAAFRQESTIEVAAMLRSLACRCAQTDSHQFPGGSETYVAGHVGKNNGPTPPRFSYLPLPTIGHPHADGMIRRVLIAEPYGGGGAHSRWARQRLRNQVLTSNSGEDRCALLDCWRKESDRMVQRYVNARKAWCSVTPVILPGFDDGKRTKAERLFLQAAAQAGLPIEAISNLMLRKAPFWPGSQHPKAYRRPDYLDFSRNRRFSSWHVHLLFREPVGGPLAIGAGRHCGLGVFAAWQRD